MANGEAGRPQITLTEDQIREVETLAGMGTTEEIAQYFGISRATFYNMMDRNPEIFRRYKKGRAKLGFSIKGSLIQKARAGDTTAQIFYLKTQCGWRETQHLEHTSPDGSMTPTAIERVIIDKATDKDT